MKKAYERFVRIRGNPHEIALGFALGIFIGMTPTLGFQMAMAVFLAALFKWNKISAAIGVWISNPLTAPFLYGATYYLGAKMLGMDHHLPQMEEISSFLQILRKAPGIFWAMTVGGVILGLPLALAAYYFSCSALQKYRDEIKRKLAERKAKRAVKKRLKAANKKRKKRGNK